MKVAHLRIWGIGSITLAAYAFALAAGRSFSRDDGVSAIAMVLTVCIAVGTAYVLALSLIRRWDFRVSGIARFKRRLTMMVVASFAAGVIHYIRFIPSEDATTFLSKTIATMLMVAGASAASLLLWALWAFPRLGQHRERRHTVVMVRRRSVTGAFDELNSYRAQRSLRRSRSR